MLVVPSLAIDDCEDYWHTLLRWLEHPLGRAENEPVDERLKQNRVRLRPARPSAIKVAGSGRMPPVSEHSDDVQHRSPISSTVRCV
jgi:hypothetical protein